jgi:hypothetical protein
MMLQFAMLNVFPVRELILEFSLMKVGRNTLLQVME